MGREHIDPERIVLNQERAYWRNTVGCPCCGKRPIVQGGDGDCEFPIEGCERFVLDEGVV